MRHDSLATHRSQLLLAAAAVAGALLSGVGAPSSARADGIFCGTRLVRTGDSPHRVTARCGSPDARQQRVEYRTTHYRQLVPCRTLGRGRRPGHGFCSVLQPQTVPVEVTEWVYDFGPQRFVQHLYFIDGRLVRIDKSGYGHEE